MNLYTPEPDDIWMGRHLDGCVCGLYEAETPSTCPGCGYPVVVGQTVSDTDGGPAHGGACTREMTA